MISTLVSLHPSDETLSRLADESEIVRARTRAGRHALHCARCRETLAAYRALGDAARDVADEELSPALHTRVVHAFNETTIVPPATVRQLVGDGERRARPSRALLRRAAYAAAACVVVAALAWPALRQRELAAADAERLSILPRYPRAGSTVRVRFVPRAGTRPADTLWLEGEIHVANANRRESFAVGVPVVREGDQYRGVLALPEGTLSGSLRLVDAHAAALNAGTLGALLLLTSDPADGERPSLDALESAAAHRPGPWQSADRFAAEFARWAPGHPMRWTLERVRSAGGVLDWLGYFSSKERRFARLSDALRRRKTVRAGEHPGMVTLAYQIEEPGLAAEWTDRLLREYPTSPWSLEMRVAEIHAMELRGVPRDSILAAMPSVESLLQSIRDIPYDHWTAQALIERYGDSATARLWRLRQAAEGNGLLWGEFTGRQAQLADRELRDSVEAGARRRLARLAGVGGPEARRTRAFAYAQLASVALSRGEPRRALALTDSTRLDSCRWIGRDTRGLAWLALGDSAGARALLLPFAGGQWSGAAAAQRALGLDVSDPRVKSLVDSAARAAMSCGR